MTGENLFEVPPQFLVTLGLLSRLDLKSIVCGPVLHRVLHSSDLVDWMSLRDLFSELIENVTRSTL